MLKNIIKSPVKLFFKWPIASFFTTLGLLIGTIVAVNRLAPAPIIDSPVEQTKEVEVYDPSQPAAISFSAKVEETPSYTLIAQTSGIVTSITKREGSSVVQGDELITLSSTLDKDSATALQAQIAQLQYGSTTQAVGRQKDAIDLQKEIAQEADTAANQITLKQLEAQEFALELGRDTAEPQLKLAELAEKLNHPSSPVTGKVDKIFVRVSDSVTPGTPLATVINTSGFAKITVNLPSNVVPLLRSDIPSEILINAEATLAYPTHISMSPTQGSLFSATYILESQEALKIPLNSYVQVNIPINTAGPTLYIPISTLHQTQSSSTVYVVSSDQTAQGKSVEPGNVIGDYVEITSGLESTDQVIITRNVVTGDKVRL
jgi:RND family efflux transporter MFP subunit